MHRICIHTQIIRLTRLTGYEAAYRRHLSATASLDV